MRRRSLAILAPLLVALSATSAVAQRVPVTLLSAPPASVAPDVDDEALLSAIASTMVGALTLPLVTPLYAYFYDSEEAFAQGLVRDAGANPARVGDHVRFATGVGQIRGIFLRRDLLRKATLVGRAGLLAHELTHVSQQALANGRAVPTEWWLDEGHADWVKYQVLAQLRLQPYARSRTVQVREIRRAGPLGDLPPLTSLSTQRGWVEARDQPGGKGATYAQAFFAAEYLIETKGPDPLLAYFRRARPARDRAAAFQDAFGVTLESFASQFARRLPEIVERAAAMTK
jgi:hypothetical protein